VNPAAHVQMAGADGVLPVSRGHDSNHAYGVWSSKPVNWQCARPGAWKFPPGREWPRLDVSTNWLPKRMR